MTIRFLELNPQFSVTYGEITESKSEVSIYSDGDVEFEVNDYEGGAVFFFINVNDLQDIVERCNEFLEKRKKYIEEGIF